MKHDILSKLYTEIGKNKKSDFVGKKFGHLTVVKDSGKRSGGMVVWECRCDCGNPNPIYVNTGNLTTGHTESCGCIGNSKNEKNISEMLRKENIPFISQLSVKIRENHFFFDFKVDDKYIIEFDGIQHFSYKESGWNTAENFEITRKNDALKNEYCFSHNIPLIRIPYDEDYTINDLKLETTRFLLTPDKVEEYYNRS